MRPLSMLSQPLPPCSPLRQTASTIPIHRVAMKAAYYEATGPAAEVLRIGELADPTAGPGEVRVRLHCSGVNPSDVKSRAGLRNRAMPFPRVVPHSDGAGVIDQVGEGVPASRIGERVWVW